MHYKLLVYPPLLVLFWTVCTLAAKMYPPVEPPPGIYYDKFLWVKFQDDLDIGLSPEGIPIDRSGGGISSPQGQAVMEYIRAQGGRWERMIAVSEARADEWRLKAALNGKTTADLNTYFHLWVGEEASAQDWLERLAELPQVEKLGRAILPARPPTPPVYDSLQRYLQPYAPADTSLDSSICIEADYSWGLLSGRGQGVKVCDIEWDWNLSHSDLPENIALWIAPGYCNVMDVDVNHGTAVLGLLAGKSNCYGITGIAPDARYAVSPVMIAPDTSDCSNEIYLPVSAFTTAMDSLEAGDVIELEIQFHQVDFQDTTRQENGPIETYPPMYACIVTAVGYGIHVVEAAGNGGEDLAYKDRDSIYIDSTKWSGAIIVGAGLPGPVLGDVNHFAREWRSDTRYGPIPNSTGDDRRIDAQGVGDLVVSLGYGDLYDDGGNDSLFTADFDGTSAATPIIAGVVVLVEALYEQCYGEPMSPAQMREIIRNIGLPQQGANSATRPIGPLPNIRMIVDSLFSCALPCCTGKRGNVDGDQDNVVDLSDLSLLIAMTEDSSFCADEMYCFDAADLNNDDTIDDDDVTILVQYLVFHIDNRANCP